MKPLRTIVTPPKPDFAISHAHKLVSVGSCFSENIGKKFGDYKFSINVNPFGQQYNPASIAQALERMLNPVPYTEGDLVFSNEQYHSFDHHSSFSRNTVAETIENINHKLQTAANDLKSANVLFLTFGTSHVFSLKDGNRVVSNCHKLPGSTFNFKLLEPDEIVTQLLDVLQQIHKINPALKIVFTVSPVRYFAFGHYENSVSKAHLFAAIYRLLKLLPGAHYFPAYELVMDDLRDYRFFAEDMLHPTQQATEYVWENLANTMFEAKTQEAIKEIDEIITAVKHRPRNPAGDAHKKFVTRNLEKIAALKAKYNLDFTAEESALKKFIV